MLKKIQIGFPALDVPQSFGEGEPAFGAKFVVKPNSEHHKAIQAAMLQVAEDQWKDKAESVLKMLTEDGKVCFVEKVYRSKKTGEPYNGFAGAHYLSARNAKTRPTVFDRTAQEVNDLGEIKRLIHSGAIVNAKVDIWAQDNKWGRRINCSLGGVMFAEAGENFGGGGSVASANDFAEFAIDASDLF
jgi:hypothetical protein